MLKVRVIALLPVKDGVVVQSLGFRRYLPVGRPEIAIEYLNRWGIDEIVLLDIDATPEERRPAADRVAEYSRHGQVPLAVGGGIRDLHDIERIIRSGADKVVLNTHAVRDPSLITEGARSFGNQCVIVSIDAREVGPGRYEAFTMSGRQPTGLSPAELAKVAEAHGAGEILLTSIDRDGSKRGYDACLVTQVVEAVRIPVIACGGVGHAAHLLEGIALGASAVAAGNFFHYTEHSAVVAKRLLVSRGSAIRLDSAVAYDGAEFVEGSRLARRRDDALDRLRFEHLPEERI